MLNRLKRRLNLKGNEQDALLDDLLEDAMDFVLGYTGRKTLPAGLMGVVVEIAAIDYNRLGLEGAASHAEGGVSDTIDLLPSRMRAQLDMYRVGRVL